MLSSATISLVIRRGLYLGLSLLLSGLIVVHAASLPAPVTRTLERYGLPVTGLSIMVQAVDSDTPLLAFAADEPRNPASAIKVLTSYVALDVLGPAYTWTTAAYLGGALRDGQLQGDLIIKGSGDPFLVMENLWLFLRGLRLRGLTQIRGDLVIDNSFFDLPAGNPAAFDNRPHQPYNVLPNALLVNFQAVRLTAYPTATGTVDVLVEPYPSNLQIDNRLQAGAGACNGGHQRINLAIDRLAEGGRVQLSGVYPLACGEQHYYRVVATPEAFSYGVVKGLWQELGGSLAGGFRRGQAPAGSAFHSWQSPPLAQIIRTANKYSNNVMTRQLLLTLGAERFGPPATLEKGRRAVNEWLQAKGVTMPELQLDNGSGLSRDTRISAASMGKLLLTAWQQPYRAEFIASLPVSAVDGTMRRRFRGEDLARQAHIKTGTLNDVRAMAGYLRSRSGREYVVVSLHNRSGVDEGIGTAVQNSLLRWVYEQ